MIFDKIPPALTSMLFFCRCDYKTRWWTASDPKTKVAPNDRRDQQIALGKMIRIWRPIFGWVIVRVKLIRRGGQIPAVRLCFENNKRAEECKIVTLVSLQNGHYEAIAFIESSVRNVFIDCQDHDAEIDVENCEIYNIPRVYVRIIGLNRLAKDHPYLRNMPVAKARKALKLQSRQQNKSFDKCLESYLLDLIETERGVSYEMWIRIVEGICQFRGEREAGKLISKWTYSPLISILVPVFNTPERFLRECFQSVLDQSYENWELCVADDGSHLPHVKAIIEEFSKRDKRIKASYRLKNGHIAAATNTALSLATGEYVAFLDHDDMLAPNALASIVEALQKEPRPKVLYSDEDKIDATGRRFDPHFKSDWNPDLLYSQNYISHLAVCETKEIKRAGGFRHGFEGSQDYDLILRVTDRIDNSLICHVPKVLYHWRAFEGSTAKESQSKLYAWSAGIRALESFFQTKQINVRVQRGVVPFTYRIFWPLPEVVPLVSIIVPTRDQPDLLKTCVSSVIKKTKYPNFELLIVNNQSQEKYTLEYLAEIGKHQKIRVIDYKDTFNFSAINNFAVSQARGDLVCLLNNDTEVVEPGWLSEMVSHALRPEIGAVGAKLLFPDNRIQHAGVICGIGGVAGHSHKYSSKEECGYFSRLVLTQNVSAVTGACLVIRRALWDAVGGMDPDNLPISFNDVDFCLRVRQLGLRNVWTPHAVLYHRESASRGKKIAQDGFKQSRLEMNYMQTRWGDYLSRDPYYSPHLSLKSEDFSISIPRSLGSNNWN